MNNISRDDLKEAVQESDGILRLDPAFVARDWINSGERMVIEGGSYDAGERGTFSERWLASVTRADNLKGPEDEGLSYLVLPDGSRLLLTDAVELAFDALAGDEYAREHSGLGRLAKIFDYSVRVPFHIHPPLEQARKTSCNPKDEAYYFPPQPDMGAHPETFLGLHQSFAKGDVDGRILSALTEWDDDRVLGTSKAYQQIEEEGFFVPSGVVHGPGTALTIELQEDSDALAMLQAVNSGQPVDKRLLFKDISEADRTSKGESAVLDWIDWDLNTAPDLYERLNFRPIDILQTECVKDSWIFIGTRKFSGKRLVLEPGCVYETTENGIHSVFVLEGRGTVGGLEVEGGVPGQDELLITTARSQKGVAYANTGDEPLVVIRFFGPDINPDAPTIVF